MTRLPLRDPHAQAASRITERGYVLVPITDPGWLRASAAAVDFDANEHGIIAYQGGAGADILPTPFPHTGTAFFVGEAWKDWALSGAGEPWRIEYRSGGIRDLARCPDFDHISSPNRWQPARHMPEWAARTRFRVLSRSALRLGEVTEEMASGMGMPSRVYRDETVHYGPPKRDGYQESYYPIGALKAWWPLWTRTPYNPESWAFCAHVERING